MYRPREVRRASKRARVTWLPLGAGEDTADRWGSKVEHERAQLPRPICISHPVHGRGNVVVARPRGRPRHGACLIRSNRVSESSYGVAGRSQGGNSVASHESATISRQFSTCSCSWSTWNAWCRGTNARWGWRSWRGRPPRSPGSPARWRCWKRWRASSSTTKRWTRKWATSISEWTSVSGTTRFFLCFRWGNGWG